MRFVVDRGRFEWALGVVGLFVGDRSAMAVLENVVLEASPGEGKEEGRVRFRGMDMESHCEVVIGARVDRGGVCTAPAGRLHEIVRLLDGSDVEVTLGQDPEIGGKWKDDGRVRVVCGRARYELLTLPAADFPQWPEMPVGVRLKLGGGAFRRALETVKVALPVKDNRRVLEGARVEVDGNDVVITGTDGKRLLKRVVCAREAERVGSVHGATLRRSFLEALVKLLGKDDEEFELCVGPRGFRAELGCVVIEGNGIEGKWPDVSTVIPKVFKESVSFVVSDLVRGVKQAVIMAEKNKAGGFARNVILGFEDGECRFDSRSSDVGAFEGGVPVGYEGKLLEVAFNGAYLLDVLGVLDSRRGVMRIVDPFRPVVLEGVGEEGGAGGSDGLSLVMPVKLADVRLAVEDPEGEEEEEVEAGV